MALDPNQMFGGRIGPAAAPANPLQQQLDALSQYYGVPITLDNSGQIKVPLAPGVTGSYRVYAPGNLGKALEAVGLDPTTGQKPAAPEGPQSYAQLTNPYGNAYMQRLQEQLAGRSEANLQRMNALMSQRGMGGTGLASARALQAQSDVGQQLLGAQQEATQLGAQFDLSRLAGLTGQQQFGRQQSEAERQAAAARSIARRSEARAERGQQAEFVANAAQGLAAQGLGITPKAQPSTTGGGVSVKSMPYESFISQYRVRPASF